VRKEPNSATFALCPRFFNLPTEDESITLQNYGDPDKIPQSYLEKASNDVADDPQFKRPKEQLDALLQAEMRRYKSMYVLSESRKDGILRHEIGHLIGLCDQYSDNEGGEYKARDFHKNCHVTIRSSAVAESVMNGASDVTKAVDEYSQDDRLGIGIMGCIDTPANAQWARLGTSWISDSIKSEIRRFKGKGALDLKFLDVCTK
jgi:hypothetical protein